jgi:hypothetical protein
MSELIGLPSELISIICDYCQIEDIIKFDYHREILFSNWGTIYKLKYKYHKPNDAEINDLSDYVGYHLENNNYQNSPNVYYFDLYIGNRILSLPHEEIKLYFTWFRIPTELLYIKLKEYPKLIIGKKTNSNLRKLYLDIIKIKESNKHIFNSTKQILDILSDTKLDIILCTFVLSNLYHNILPNCPLHVDIRNSLKHFYIQIKDEIIKYETTHTNQEELSITIINTYISRL